MPIGIRCPACHASYVVADTVAGKTLLCKQCQAAIVVPKPGEPLEMASVPQAPPPLPPDMDFVDENPNLRPRAFPVAAPRPAFRPKAQKRKTPSNFAPIKKSAIALFFLLVVGCMIVAYILRERSRVPISLAIDFDGITLSPEHEARFKAAVNSAVHRGGWTVQEGADYKIEVTLRSGARGIVYMVGSERVVLSSMGVAASIRDKNYELLWQGGCGVELPPVVHAKSKEEIWDWPTEKIIDLSEGMHIASPKEVHKLEEAIKNPPPPRRR